MDLIEHDGDISNSLAGCSAEELDYIDLDDNYHGEEVLLDDQKPQLPSSMIILSTLDGRLYAYDSQLRYLWSSSIGDSLIVGKNSKIQNGKFEDSEDFLVLPSLDGTLFYQNPRGVVKTLLNVEYIVHRAPFSSTEDNRSYSGNKNTQHFGVDPISGNKSSSILPNSLIIRRTDFSLLAFSLDYSSEDFSVKYSKVEIISPHRRSSYSTKLPSSILSPHIHTQNQHYSNNNISAIFSYPDGRVTLVIGDILHQLSFNSTLVSAFDIVYYSSGEFDSFPIAISARLPNSWNNNSFSSDNDPTVFVSFSPDCGYIAHEIDNSAMDFSLISLKALSLHSLSSTLTFPIHNSTILFSSSSKNIVSTSLLNDSTIDENDEENDFPSPEMLAQEFDFLESSQLKSKSSSLSPPKRLNILEATNSIKKGPKIGRTHQLISREEVPFSSAVTPSSVSIGQSVTSEVALANSGLTSSTSAIQTSHDLISTAWYSNSYAWYSAQRCDIHSDIDGNEMCVLGEHPLFTTVRPGAVSISDCNRISSLWSPPSDNNRYPFPDVSEIRQDVTTSTSSDNSIATSHSISVAMFWSPWFGVLGILMFFLLLFNIRKIVYRFFLTLEKEIPSLNILHPLFSYLVSDLSPEDFCGSNSPDNLLSKDPVEEKSILGKLSNSSSSEIHSKRKLVVSNIVIGRGCTGNYIFLGKFGDRNVAVKRILIEQSDIATRYSKLPIIVNISLYCLFF